MDMDIDMYIYIYITFCEVFLHSIWSQFDAFPLTSDIDKYGTSKG